MPHDAMGAACLHLSPMFTPVDGLSTPGDA